MMIVYQLRKRKTPDLNLTYAFTIDFSVSI